MKMTRKTISILFILCISHLSLTSVGAQAQVLVDTNGDELVVVMGFGDSITYGVGDDTPPGAYVDMPNLTDGSRGYLTRISSLGGVATINKGVPGEFLSIGGINRLPNAVAASNADIVLLMEGANDSSIQLDSKKYRLLYQKAINVIRALGRIPVAMKEPLPCCDRIDRVPFIQAYNANVADLAAINGIHIVDLAHTWETTCQNKSSCELFNIPDGIHPNSLGYDAIGQTVLATLFEIDIYSESGAKDLEAALSLAEGTIIVKPNTPPLEPPAEPVIVTP